jgi:aryl carrier-like protein
MLKILWQISEIDLNDRDVLQEQLLGVDSTYMLHLIAELRDVQGKVDATYLAKLIDDIFE